MNVILIDDDILVTTALKTILEADPDLKVVASGNTGTEAVELYERFHPEVLVMDIRMKDMDGLEASEQILSRHSDAKILLLTTFSDDEYILKALHLGTRGYLLKQDYAHIIPAIRAVAMGQTVFGRQVSHRLPEMLRKKSGLDWSRLDISEKELEIIQGVAKGLSNREIAEALFLSEGTVRNYLSTILNKLNLRDRTQLAIFYLKEAN